MRFKTASRSLDELEAAKKKVDELFIEAVRGPNRTLNKNGIKYLDENRYEIAELIVQLISDTVLVTDPTPYLVDQVDGDIRDQYVWQELDSTLRVVQRSYGSKPLSQRLTFKEWGIVTTHKEIAVEIPLEEVAVGRVTPSMVANAVAETINRNRISTILAGIDAGVTAGDDHTGESGYTLRYTGMTADNLDHALDGLLDESESPVMFGRHIAMAPAIRGFTGWSEETKREFDLRGQIGTYHGAPIITLRDQFHKREDGHLISKDRVWLASGTKGAKFQTKDVSFLNWAMVDPRTSTFGTGTRLEDGLLVHDPYQYRIIEVS